MGEDKLGEEVWFGWRKACVEPDVATGKDRIVKGRINGLARMDWSCELIMSIEGWTFLSWGHQQWKLSGGIIDMGKKWKACGRS